MLKLIIQLVLGVVLSKHSGSTFGWDLPEFLDMGEAGGYHYTAKVVTKTVHDDDALFVWEVAREKDGNKETVFHIDLSDDKSLEYAGVFPDNRYFYLAGYHYLDVYPVDKPQEEITIHREEIGNIRQTGIVNGDLHYLWMICAEDPGTLNRVDIEKRDVEEMVSGAELYTLFIPEEGCVLYSDWAPDNSDTLRALLGDNCNLSNAVDAIMGDICSEYSLYWVLNLKTGERERLFSAQASSTLVEEGKPADALSADKAVDGDISTAWVEGVEGPGIGESLTINLGRECELYRLSLIPGFTKSQEVYWGNNRVKKVRVELSDCSHFEQNFSDEMHIQEIKLPDYIEELKTSYIKMTILDAYPGTRRDDTAISEVTMAIGR
jgi:hypothetical protein